MRIGIDARLWNETGVGRYIRNLVKELQIIDGQNEYVLFVKKDDKEQILKQVQNDNFRMVDVNIRWHTIEEQIKFPKILNRENLDLMHFPYYSIPVFYNNPFIVTIHDLIPYNYPTGKASTLPFFLYWLKFLAYKYVLKNASKKAKKIIAVSNATKQEIINNLKINANKIAVIHEGAEEKLKIKISKPGLSSRIQTGFVSSKYFLYVGNVFPHKNLERLLKAFNVLIFKHKDVLLALVGGKDYFYKKLKERVREMDLGNSIKFLGKVGDEELKSLYQNAVALVQPSLMEGFGLPALEAMTNGCIVLASDIPALKEVCGDAAIYFNPLDVVDIRKNLELIVNDEELRKKMIGKGYKQVKKFSWEKMAKETFEVYESCTRI